MIHCGHSQQIAWQCAEAVRLRDHPEQCKKLPEPAQTLRSLLHDADTLDVMRVRSTFYMDRLIRACWLNNFDPPAQHPTQTKDPVSTAD